mmetsp:Transcript_78292/g.162634  ORF Transcript_78292/g.162634 Transcript_78292/m.162634 type:complete len:371 (+) Transcript_78292:101-1213(+)
MLRIFAPDKEKDKDNEGKTVPASYMVGKLDGNNGNQPRTPWQVGLQEEGIGWARVEPDVNLNEDEDGWRPGKLLDVKPGLHWILVPVEGGYKLRRAHGWYEFKRTPVVGRQRAGARATPAAKAAVAGGHLKADSERAQREAEMRRREAAARYEALRNRSSADDEEGKVELPVKDDDLDLDETGEKKQRRKRRKIMRKAGQAAEEFDVVGTANEMKELKRAEGEDGWENEDEEQFSDDEEDNFESFVGMERDENVQEEAPALVEVTGEEAEGIIEDAEPVDEMNEHGQALQALLEGDPDTLWEQGDQQVVKAEEGVDEMDEYVDGDAGAEEKEEEEQQQEKEAKLEAKVEVGLLTKRRAPAKAGMLPRKRV